MVVLEETRDGLADWAVSHHDSSMPGAGRRGPGTAESRFRRKQRMRAGRKPAPQTRSLRDQGCNGINEPVQQRIESDGNDGCGDHGVQGSVREQAQLFAEYREDEGELA